METKLAANALSWGSIKFSYSDLREALSAASAKHQELSRLASAGQGFDRHLFAMKCLSKSLDIAPTPAIFEDPTYSFANHFILSTSHLYADNVCSGMALILTHSSNTLWIHTVYYTMFILQRMILYRRMFDLTGFSLLLSFSAHRRLWPGR